VLDRPGAAASDLVVDETEDEADIDEPVEPETVESETADIDEPAEESDEPAEESDEPVEDDQAEATPRRRTTPEPGSAAERAAARRAKLRAEREKGGR
jgi:hypothetical protein